MLTISVAHTQTQWFPWFWGCQIDTYVSVILFSLTALVGVRQDRWPTPSRAPFPGRNPEALFFLGLATWEVVPTSQSSTAWSYLHALKHLKSLWAPALTGVPSSKKDSSCLLFISHPRSSWSSGEAGVALTPGACEMTLEQAQMWPTTRGRQAHTLAQAQPLLLGRFQEVHLWTWVMANLQQGGEEHAIAACSHSLLAALVFRVAEPCKNSSKGDGGHKDAALFFWDPAWKVFFSVKLLDRLITLELSGKAGFVGLIWWLSQVFLTEGVGLTGQERQQRQAVGTFKHCGDKRGIKIDQIR